MDGICRQGLATILIIWDMFTIPLELFPLRKSTVEVVDAVSLVSFIYWVVDVPLHLIFGLQIGGAIEMRPRFLGRHYLRSWFLMDVFLIMIDTVIASLELIQASSSNPLFRSGRLVRILRMVRLVRLLRVAKLEREFMLLANHFLSAYTVMALKIVWYLMLMLAVNHLIACCWYGVGSWTTTLGNWLQRANIDETDFAQSYVAAMHWSLTQFTPSTNPIAPDNGWERFYAIWVILLAMACFSSFLGSIGSSVNSMRMARNEELMQSAKLERFFMERNLSVELFSKVKSAIRADGLVKIRLCEDDVTLMRSIPERFKIQLHTEMFWSSLMECRIWPSWKHREDKSFFISVCHHSMRENVCKLGQDVFLPNTKCNHAYILQSGSLEYNVHRLAPTHCEADGDNNVLCLPAIWAEWEHTGRLFAAAGLCYYISVDCAQVCKAAGSFGGEMFEFLKILGLLIVGRIEDLYDRGEIVTDVLFDYEVDIPDFVQRAENFACLKTAQSERTDFLKKSIERKKTMEY
ncbi:KCNH6 [Symbiodinium microadriaticum]|nr:KCNH6 [Symbiodinium microadriaticum]